MKTWKLVILFVVLFTKQAYGQGTFLFTWHGQSNFFQASFELTADDMVPGGRFTSPTFLGSMTVDSLSGEHYHGGDSSSFGTGGFYADNPGVWWLGFQLNDFNSGIEVKVSNSLIYEQYMSGPDLYFEPGYWTYAQVPEPSFPSLAALSVGAWMIRRGRGGRFVGSPRSPS